MAASVVLLLALIAALSTATRQPGLQVSTAPWHTWKAGYMAEAEAQETTQTRQTAPCEMPGEAAAVSLPAPVILIPVEVVLPPQSSTVVESPHLRAPPAVG